MIQVGEFSFVLAELGLGVGVITGYTYSLILGSAIITILLTPFVFSLTSKISVMRRTAMQVAGRGEKQLATGTSSLSNHVIVCGYGRVGGTIARILSQLAIPYVVTDLDPKTIAELQAEGVRCVYGDAGNPNVLHQAGIKEAIILVLAVADPVAVRLALDYARQVNPSLEVIARAHNDSEFKFLQARDVSGVVRPETEAGLEIVRHILCRLNVPAAEVEETIANQRKVCPM
jgi:CPA2 family monovalent cation:H+ antiporter-2